MRITHAESTIADYIQQYQMDRFLNENLLAELQLFQFSAYSNVYYARDEQHYFYFLVDGQVQCSHYHQNGKLAVLALSNPFSAIGDVEILSDTPVKSNVVATRETTLLGIDVETVEYYGAEDPRFLRFLLDEVRRKLYQTNILQMGQVLPVVSRLAHYLLAQPPLDETDAVILPDKEALASLLSVTPRHLNRVLRELSDAGTISAGYPLVHLLDRGELQRLAE